jgi:hypothetical protein
LNINAADDAKHSSDKSSVYEAQPCDLGQLLAPNVDIDWGSAQVPEQEQRYVEFSASLIIRLIRDNRARRPRLRAQTGPVFVPTIVRNEGETIFDEVQDVIVHPTVQQQSPQSGCAVTLSDELEKEVKLFVTQLSMLYRKELPYHNMEHSCHATMVRVTDCDHVMRLTNHAFVVNDEILVEADRG